MLQEHHTEVKFRELTQYDECKRTGRGIVPCGRFWSELNDYGVLHLTVYNFTAHEYRFSRIRIIGELSGDVTGWVRIGTAEPTRSDQVEGRIPANGQLALSMIVRDPKRAGSRLHVELSGADVHTAARLVDLVGPPAGRGRITIRLQPSIGARWLANPVDDKDLGAAMLVGIGVRGSYAFLKAFAIEAELAGIRSNDARFIDATMGEIHRSINGARFLLGGAVRLGEKYQPYARLGVGAQGVDHDVRVMTDQNPTTGPGDGFSLDVLFTFGTGIDVQLGKNWTAGTGFNFVTGLKSTKSSSFNSGIEGGIYLGYGWGGYEPEPW